MGRKKPAGSGEGQTPEKKTTTKINPDLLRKARMVAVYKDIDLYDYIDSILRPAVDRDYDRMIRDESKSTD